MPRWRIRPADAADIPAITAMYRFDGFPHAQGDPARAGFQFGSVRAAGGCVLIAEEGDAVVGHLELLNCHEAPPLGRYGYVEALEVRADQRRQGIGRALLETAIERTRAMGGARLETVAEDAVSAAFYGSVGITTRAQYLDLDLYVPPEALAGASLLGLALPPGFRPWLTYRHVAGRQYPAVYCWTRAFQAGQWMLPEAEGTGAWLLPDSGAVVLADPWLVHLFIPPNVAPDSSHVWPAWLAMLGLRAGRREGYVRTVVEAGLAARLRLLERWPDSTAEPFTLLAHDLKA